MEGARGVGGRDPFLECRLCRHCAEIFAIAKVVRPAAGLRVLVSHSLNQAQSELSLSNETKLHEPRGHASHRAMHRWRFASDHEPSVPWDGPLSQVGLFGFPSSIKVYWQRPVNLCSWCGEHASLRVCDMPPRLPLTLSELTLCVCTMPPRLPWTLSELIAMPADRGCGPAPPRLTSPTTARTDGT